MVVSRRRTKKPDWQQEIAKERIDILLGLAENDFRGKTERSRRYVELARKISLRFNVRLKSGQKRKFCKKCNSLLIPGVSSTVRLDDKKKLLIIRCKNCKAINTRSYMN